MAPAEPLFHLEHKTVGTDRVDVAQRERVVLTEYLAFVGAYERVPGS